MHEEEEEEVEEEKEEEEEVQEEERLPNCRFCRPGSLAASQMPPHHGHTDFKKEKLAAFQAHTSRAITSRLSMHNTVQFHEDSGWLVPRRTHPVDVISAVISRVRHNRAIRQPHGVAD